MPTNSGFGNGSAAIQASSASIRSASEREASTVWNTIALHLRPLRDLARDAQPLGHGLVGRAAQIIHESTRR